MRQGSTLIELSIVLVIIGLIVGGVLTGQTLIAASQVRATLTQVEKFNSAVNTFYGKYGALPGDLNAQVAKTFGFSARGSSPGQGDGNGVLQGNGACGWQEEAGETAMFWVDLTSANGLNVNLIDGTFSQATSTTEIGTLSGSGLDTLLPAAKLGNGNRFYVYSNTCAGGGNSVNYYGLSLVTSVVYGVTNGCGDCLNSNPGITVKQAYDIDTKIDDGLPLTGSVTAVYLAANSFGSQGAGAAPNATNASSATCYDTTSSKYSLTQNNGNGVNCALSFKMQAGD